MNQLFQIIISITLGFIYGLIFQKLNKNHLITLIITLLLTIFYITIIYYLNNGIINYILKISIISGFIIQKKCKNFKESM